MLAPAELGGRLGSPIVGANAVARSLHPTPID
jgi:hypothetical protein